jgi:predicted Zn-ribbon and HTH transcriptional regulator
MNIYESIPEVLREGIVRLLIFQGPLTVTSLAVILDVDWDEVSATVNDLYAAGQIRTRSGSAVGDCYCPHCQSEWADEEPGNLCPSRHCGGYVRDDCRWVFCGGPVSQALSATAEVSAR